MRRRILLVALVMLLVLAGCSKPVTAQYESALTREATSVAGLAETGIMPTAFKVAEKKRTEIAVSTGSGATAGSSGASGNGAYRATVIGIGPIGGDNTATLFLTVSRAEKPVPGARATVTCTYVSGDGRQSQSYTMTTGADGRATKAVSATPYGSATKVTISGYVLADGSRVTLKGVGYRTTGS